MRRDFVWPTANQISNFRRSYEAIWRRSGKVLTIVCAPAPLRLAADVTLISSRAGTRPQRLLNH